ncbi:MAG: pyruvate kinase [Alphaproteobacteria bacterium]|nr:pyruvate kinase [Alphaproteobacteria bacterium]
MKRTKIICTIGPRTDTEDGIRTLIEAGMDVARLNGSHNTLEWHAATIARIRKVAPHVPILLDIPGRKIRTHGLAHEPTFKAGEVIVLTTDTSHDGSRKVPVNYARLHEDLRAGHTILADDGTLRFTVERLDGQDIHCRAETAGQLKSRKGINVPFVKLQNALITERDQQMMGFVREHGVDFVGISFVESAAHVETIRELAGGDWPRIVSKIENQGGLDHMEEVIVATDAVMIDRGDLSVETNLENLSLFQKRIIAAAEQAAKPVIVATEMLHTMIANPVPTKAEVSDISNAVLDGCAATMLSGETAIGEFPFEAVRTMRRVADAAATYIHPDPRNGAGRAHVPHVMAEAIALMCHSLPITKIVAVTRSGYAARTIAARRPAQPILAVSDDLFGARSFNLLAGVEGVHLDLRFSRTSTDHIIHCLEALWRMGKIADEDMVLVTGIAYPRSGNRMNLLQTHVVGDLAETLNWRRAGASSNPRKLGVGHD